MENENYGVYGFLTGCVVFAIVWVYALFQWGVLIGLVVGWLPALIAAIIFGAIWPLTWGLVALFFYLLYKH